MPAVFNAAIAYLNRADAGTVSATSAIPLAPASRLQNPHVARKWRSASNAAEAVVVDLGAAVAVDTLALVGLSLSAAGTARARMSNTDSSAQAGEAYDSAAILAAVDPRYGLFLHLVPAPITARYVRIDLSDPGAAYIEAGRLFVGQRTQFATNFAPGWTRGWSDLSKRTLSRGGQTFIDPGVTYRSISLTFDAVTEAERNGVVEEIDRVAGLKSDLLLITRPDSDNLGRDSLWGLVSDMDPVGQPQLVWINGAPGYQKTYRITERL